MSGTLARTDREAKEAAERRAQLAEARVRDLEERLDRALAAITDALAEGERLREALRDCLAYLWPSPDEGHTGFVDRLGMQFYDETRIWPPFKSAPMETAREPTEEDRRAWRAWLEAKRDQAAAAGAALVSPSPRPAENEGNEGERHA
jgi:hypothetical protein